MVEYKAPNLLNIYLHQPIDDGRIQSAITASVNSVIGARIELQGQYIELWRHDPKVWWVQMKYVIYERRMVDTSSRNFLCDVGNRDNSSSEVHKRAMQ